MGPRAAVPADLDQFDDGMNGCRAYPASSRLLKCGIVDFIEAVSILLSRLTVANALS